MVNHSVHFALSMPYTTKPFRPGKVLWVLQLFGVISGGLVSLRLGSCCCRVQCEVQKWTFLLTESASKKTSNEDADDGGLDECSAEGRWSSCSRAGVMMCSKLACEVRCVGSAGAVRWAVQGRRAAGTCESRPGQDGRQKRKKPKILCVGDRELEVRSRQDSGRRDRNESWPVGVCGC